MSTPTWVTTAGTLGTIPEGVFYATPVVATAGIETVQYRVIAGKLPPGIQLDETGVISGNPQASAQGIPFDVAFDTTSTFVVRAFTESTINGLIVVTGLADRTFSITVTNQSTVVWITPSGDIGDFVDGVQVTDLQVQYRDSNIFATDIVTLIAGNLPPGLQVSTSGLIFGLITPDPAATVAETNYSFSLRVDNGISSDVRTFSINVFARSLITADTTTIEADNTYITADVGVVQPPVILTPVGNIGSSRSDNFFAFQFIGQDFSGNPIEFLPVTNLPPGLTLDPNSGWLYGYIPYLGLVTTDYTFQIRVRETLTPSNASDPYSYTLTVLGPVSSDVTWLTPADAVAREQDPASLGVIDNGSVSTFYVEAISASGFTLQYRLLSGTDSRLPQGLQLLPSGLIAGRVSFDTFALDGGTTTFDVGLNTVDQPTTFDMVCTFTVNAFSSNGIVNTEKTFSIRVIRAFNAPYDNLYIQAMPPQDDRVIIDALLQNPDIFVPELIYRSDDPNFGVAKRVIYNHAYGLSAASLEDYVSSLYLNHYWKNLVLGEIKTAQALDDDGNILYEVVYSDIIDDLVNNQDISVGKQVSLAFPINAGDSSEITLVYPNSLQNMRDQVIDTVGQTSRLLPRWMLSRQANGGVLGFTPAWVIAYTNPGQSGQIAYNIRTLFQTPLNLIDFKVDRYELDNFLTKNWNREEQYWGFEGNDVIPHPPSLTVFDVIGIPPDIPQFSDSVAYQVGDQVIYQNVERGYRFAKIYQCIQNTTPGILPILPPGLPDNSAYWEQITVDGLADWTNNANTVVQWEDNLQTLATWTYATPGDNNQGTTFDDNSLLFTAPVDMYSSTATTEFDKYLVFPKRNILE
jgi:hypothetical protein